MPDLLAAAMAAVACFHAGRLALAAMRRGSTEIDVDVVHTVMGVSMAGMLTGSLTGSWNDACVVAFGAATFWFGRGIVRGLSDERAVGAAVTHHLPHFVVSALMLYMLLVMRWTMTGSRMSLMGGVTGTGGMLLPSVLAVLVVANAAVVAWRAFALPGEAFAVFETAASSAHKHVDAHMGSHVSLGAASSEVETAGSAPHRPSGTGILAPRGAPACLLVMSMVMAYMVVAAHP